jgi:hypothetical protein
LTGMLTIPNAMEPLQIALAIPPPTKPAHRRVFHTAEGLSTGLST